MASDLQEGPAIYDRDGGRQHRATPNNNNLKTIRKSFIITLTGNYKQGGIGGY